MIVIDELKGEWVKRDFDSCVNYHLAWLEGKVDLAGEQLDLALKRSAINATSAEKVNRLMERALLPYKDWNYIKDMGVVERLDVMKRVAANY